MESAENQAPANLDSKSESNISPPLSKTETIALLNDTIDRLEETIRRISEDSAKLPSADSINTLLTTTQALEAAVTPTPEVKVSKPQPLSTTQPATRQTTKTSVKAPTKTKVQIQKKSNTGLIVIGVTAIAIAIVTVFWLWKPQAIVNLFPKAEPVPKVAVDLDAIPDTTFQPSPASPLSDAADDLNNSAAPSASDFPATIEPVAEPIEDVVETIIPPELTSPGKPKKLKMVTIKPELNFTPEQNFIAAIETKLGELAQDYSSKPIKDVQANLSDNSLVVEVTDDWYQLDELGQNNLGNEMLQRSRALSFKKLELKDQVGTLIARNPIIGDNIIILQPKKPQLPENSGNSENLS